MKYELRASGDQAEAVTAELKDNFAAETWARDWVQANAASDRYRLRREDGGLVMSVFRTKAGQWYLTPAQAEAS